MTAFSTVEMTAVTGVNVQVDVQLSDTERQPCEVWTRVMGNHRPVSSFPIGKQGEHYERQLFAARRCAD